MRLLPASLVLCLLSIPSIGHGDEAVLTDGQRVSGTLTLLGDGRLHFVVPKRPTPLSVDAIHHVRFPLSPFTPLRAGTLHHVLLQAGQRVTGELLGMDEGELRVRTAWSEQLRIPRHAVISVTHPRGLVTIFDDDFESGLTAWKTTGKPLLNEQQHTSGKCSLVLTTPGQSVEHEIGVALEAGSLGVNFHESAPTAGALWLLEAEFQGARTSVTIRVFLAGRGTSYQAEVGDLDSGGALIPRTPGWHRLELGFTRGSLRITVDDAVVAYSLKHGPGGSLRRVQLACIPSGNGEKPTGSVAFDDFSVTRVVHEARGPARDAGQDGVWLLDGDQLFGHVTKADRRTLKIDGRFGTRVFPWSEVRGLFLRELESHPQKPEGERVRVELRSEAGPENDVLDGIVAGLDERKLTLRSSLLGALEIERGRLHRLRKLSLESSR